LAYRATGFGFLGAAVATTAAAAGSPPPVPPSGSPAAGQAGQDTVVLRSGDAVQGTILSEDPGRHVILLEERGVRTIAWDDVQQILRSIPGPPPVRALAPHESAQNALDTGRTAPLPELAWAGVSLGWDARVEGSALLKSYAAGGAGAVLSAGGGVGASVSASLHFRAPATVLDGGGTSWLDFELGVGDAIRRDYWNEGAGLSTAFFENETSAIVGAHLARGRFQGLAHPVRWSGLVLGMAWVPTYVHFLGGSTFAAGGRLNPAGLRWTLDWGDVARTGIGRVPMVRLFVTWLPYVGALPTALSAGMGCVFF
jgi:hypothetical protein